MTDDEEEAPSAELPDELIDRIEPLDLGELDALLSYVEDRIETRRSPFEREIEADSAGEVVGIETHGAYALVRMRSPDQDSQGADGDGVSLYHVQREPRIDGTESLHWSYLGDVSHPEGEE